MWLGSRGDMWSVFHKRASSPRNDARIGAFVESVEKKIKEVFDALPRRESGLAASKVADFIRKMAVAYPGFPTDSNKPLSRRDADELDRLLSEVDGHPRGGSALHNFVRNGASSGYSDMKALHALLYLRALEWKNEFMNVPEATKRIDEVSDDLSLIVCAILNLSDSGAVLHTVLQNARVMLGVPDEILKKVVNSPCAAFMGASPLHLCVLLACHETVPGRRYYHARELFDAKVLLLQSFGADPQSKGCLGFSPIDLCLHFDMLRDRRGDMADEILRSLLMALERFPRAAMRRSFFEDEMDYSYMSSMYSLGLPSAHKLLNRSHDQKDGDITTALDELSFKISLSVAPKARNHEDQTVPIAVVMRRAPAKYLRICKDLGCDFGRRDRYGKDVFVYWREMKPDALKLEYADMLSDLLDSDSIPLLRLPDADSILPAGLQKDLIWNPMYPYKRNDHHESNRNLLHDYVLKTCSKGKARKSLLRWPDPKLFGDVKGEECFEENVFLRISEAFSKLQEERDSLQVILLRNLEEVFRTSNPEADLMAVCHDGATRRCCVIIFMIKFCQDEQSREDLPQSRLKSKDFNKVIPDELVRKERILVLPNSHDSHNVGREEEFNGVLTVRQLQDCSTLAAWLKSFGFLAEILNPSLATGAQRNCWCQGLLYLWIYKNAAQVLPETHFLNKILGTDLPLDLRVTALLSNAQLHALKALVEGVNAPQPQHRHICIVGAAGTGKTFLALTFLKMLADEKKVDGDRKVRLLLPATATSTQKKYFSSIVSSKALKYMEVGNLDCDVASFKQALQACVDAPGTGYIVCDQLEDMPLFLKEISQMSVNQELSDRKLIFISLVTADIDGGITESSLKMSMKTGCKIVSLSRDGCHWNRKLKISDRMKPSTRQQKEIARTPAAVKLSDPPWIPLEKPQILTKVLKALLIRVVFAVDRSGSTDKCPNYWTRVKSQLEEILSEEKDTDVMYILWNDVAREVQLPHLQAVIAHESGDGCTVMSSICGVLTSDAVFGDKKGLQRVVKFYLCTDGQIDKQEVDRTDELLKGFAFALVCIQIEAPPSESDVSVSVAAPFLRLASYQVFVNGAAALEGNSLNRLSFPDINSLEEFEAAKDKLWSQIYPRLGGNKNNAKDEKELQSWLIATKRKILANLSHAAMKENKSIGKILRMLMENKEQDVLAIIAKGHSISEPTPGQIVEAAFAPLMNIAYARNFSVGAYKKFPSQAIERKADVEQADDVTLWGDFNSTGDLQAVCSITGDLDISVLIIRALDNASHGLFLDLSPKIADRLSQQPLFALRTEVTRDRLLKIMDHPIGLKAFLSWVHENGHNTSPYTRQILAGCLPISSDQALVTYTNKFVCHLLWGGKLVGIPVMWLWVFYFLIKDQPGLEYIRLEYRDVVESMQSVLVTRTNNEVTRLGMSGLGDFPLELVPVSVACWYVARGSSTLYAEDTASRVQERLLQFRSLARELADIVKLCGIPIDVESVVQRANHLRLLELLFNVVNTDENYAQKLLGTMRYERFEFDPSNMEAFSTEHDDGRFVLWDRPLKNADKIVGDPKLPEVLRQNSVEVAQSILHQLYPYRRGGPQEVKKYTGIPLPLELEPVEAGISDVRRYGYRQDSRDRYIFANSPVCPGTMRCYTVDQCTGKPWKVAAEEAMGPVEAQVSAYNLYAKTCTKIFKGLTELERNTGKAKDGHPVGFPSMKDILQEVERSQRLRGFALLPRDFDEAVQSVLEDYAWARAEYERVIGEVVTPRVLIQILTESQGKERRSQLEEEWKRKAQQQIPYE